jgi:hypothetical protein
MGKNNKPILSVLVDADKKDRFADLARQHKQSMGWVLNDCIDRMLAANSIDIYMDSVGSTDNPQKSEKVGVSALDIEEMIKTYVSNHLDIPSIDSGNVEELVRASIETALQPINESVRELETYTQSQFVAMRDELKKAIGDRSVTTESIATIETTPAKTTPLKEGEYISFAQLAKQLGYSIPNGVKATNPRKEGADNLIAFAASQGQSYGWDGKKQKFYRTDGN